MPEKSRYVKRVDKSQNIIEEYVVKKHGSISNFLSSMTKFNKAGHEIKRTEDAIKDKDFLEKMELGMKICGSLKIDFVELFGNGNVSMMDSGGGLRPEQYAEGKYARLAPSARRKTLEYINNMLEN